MKLPDGFAATYNAELLCSSVPEVSKPALLAAIRRRCPRSRPLDEKVDSSLLAFIHPDHMVTFSDGSVPAQTLVAVSDKRPSIDALEKVIQQSWSFAKAQTVVNQAAAAVLVSDIMSSSLEYRERLELFLKVLRACLDVVPAEGIHWIPSQQITDPERFREAFGRHTESDRFFAGPINVRLFRIEGRSGEMIMDSLGLAALGLPDVQCHFRELKPDDVSRLLHNIAYYLFQKGDVIEDGHTVEGAATGSKWRCRHEAALVPPKREVLDINPGAPFAAGGRT
jgi:hypothetical protein